MSSVAYSKAIRRQALNKLTTKETLVDLVQSFGWLCSVCLYWQPFHHKQLLVKLVRTCCLQSDKISLATFLMLFDVTLVRKWYQDTLFFFDFQQEDPVCLKATPILLSRSRQIIHSVSSLWASDDLFLQADLWQSNMLDAKHFQVTRVQDLSRWHLQPNRCCNWHLLYQ